MRKSFAYWDRIRGVRLAPSWPEIDPGAIKCCLPFLLVSEVFGEPFDLRYRLAGTEIVASYGYDPTGMTCEGSPPPPGERGVASPLRQSDRGKSPRLRPLCCGDRPWRDLPS